ncbi:MAG TPA: FxSxx-COOH system tetratricopeptide repeat protein [Trebonia sp.]|nr:FxSxx-COOH system tetratricopeptide repeat protein [Trebonia sp.]
MTEPGNGQVITFYSYKGGTGRTMALANVAWIIASSGKRVLVVDWDLESPGLHKFFHPFLDESIIGATPGVIEIINDYQTESLNPSPRPDDWYLDYARVDRHAVSLDWEFPGDGKLDFLSAGRQNRDYSAAVCSLDWDNFYERLGGGRFFRALRENMKQNYDYVLIDSRTGLSDVADICTVELPDVLAVCFTLSDQSIEGAAKVARQISSRYRDRNIRVMPVPMRIEDGEKEKLDLGRATARRRFAGFPQDMSQADAVAYWSAVEVPYKPFYAFEEILATFGDAPGSPASLLAAFERITGAVTGGEVTAMQPISDEIRLQYKEAFARRPSAELIQVYLSYAPEDRMWADWIEAVLSRAGFRVTPRSTVSKASAELEAEDAFAGSARVIAILSTAYMSSPEARSLWRALVAADAAGIRRQIVPVRVTDVRIGEQFGDYTTVDLARMDGAQAMARLLWAFDRPVQSAGTQGDVPRFPGTVPRIWSAPARNADFTGRAETLELLRDKLSGSGAVIVAQALYGLGGVGKTQLALEYAYRFMADYDLVWWVPSERAEEITQSLADLARKMELRVGDNVAEAAEAALDELRRDSIPRWLLVFDNADNPKQLESYLPMGNGHVIITSRNQAWTNTADLLEVDVFSREESVAHLLRHVPNLDVSDAIRVAEALGDLPLAIEQASAWLEQTGMSAQAYVAELATQATRILGLNQPSDYSAPVVATWNMSFDRLRARSPAAVRLLQILAFCSPGPISMNLLYSEETILALLPYDPTLSERLMLGRIIRDISRFALVKVDQGSNSLQIHRLVQAVIRAQMTDEEQTEARHELHKILVGARPRQGETDDPANWSTYEIIWPHLGPSVAEECDDPRTRQLLIDWVRYHWKIGEFEACLSLAQRLETTWTRQLGADDQQTLLLRFHIANVMRSQGRYQEARDLDTAVLERQHAVLGVDHPHALMTAGSLAADYKALGDFRKALASDQRTYASFKEQFGEDYPRTLVAAFNLAISYRLVGDYKAARRLDQDTLDRRRVVLPPDHPYTLDTAANLALDMRAEGAFRDSVELLRVTWEKYRAVLDDDMIEPLRTATSLAVSLRKAGDQAEAMRLAQDTYNRYKRRHGSQSPEARICALNLACDYAAVGEFARALDLALDVKGALSAGLGDDHPNTLVAANNLGCYLRAIGRYTEALQVAEDTAAHMQLTLGEDHPMSLSSAINLANCLGDARNLVAAETLQRRTLASLTRVLGADHPDTLVCKADLAVTLRDAGRIEESEELATTVLGELERALGDGHPDIMQMRAGQRINRDLEPQMY